MTVDVLAEMGVWVERHAGPAPTEAVREWVAKMAAMCDPAGVYWCDGTLEERQKLIATAVSDGVLIPLNQQKLPGCYLHRSNPNDVARTEQCTFICTSNRDSVGPTNNWLETKAAYKKLEPL